MSSQAKLSKPARAADFDPTVQPVRPCPTLPRLSAACLSVDVIREAFSRTVPWSVDPLFALSFEPDHLRDSGARAAAVLMPLVQRGDGVHVLFTRRADHLHHHAGQISFPGGRLESFDAGPVEAALRETREEIGVASRYIDVIGVQPTLLTTTDFLITPVIAALGAGFHTRPDGDEVAEIFEVPLSFLMDPAHHVLHQLESPEGPGRHYFAIPWGDYFIWGATAVLIRNFYHFLAAAYPQFQER